MQSPPFRIIREELDENSEPADDRADWHELFWTGILVRRFLSTHLIGLILACPLLCQAAQAHVCADGDAPTSLPFESPGAPSPCPDDGISCISAGAVQSADLRAADLTPGLLLPNVGGWLLSALMPPIPLALLHLSGDGAQPDRAPWGAPQRLHALTQHFRC